MTDPSFSSILGPDGRPARLSEAQRTEDLLGSYDSYNALSFRLPPYNPDTLIASKGYKSLDDLLTLGAVRAPLNIVRTSVFYKGWSWVPMIDGKPADKASGDYEKAAMVADALTSALMSIEDDAGNTQDFRQVLWEISYAVHVGFSLQDIKWKLLKYGPYKGKYGFKRFADKPAQQIGFDLDLDSFAVNGITSYTPLKGYRFGIPVEKVILYTFQPSKGLPYGNGLGRTAYKHGWTIDFLLKYWNLGLELFGTPFILGKASPGKSMELARKAIAQIRQGAPAVLPIGVEAELKEIAGTGLAAYLAAAQHHKEQIALIYLGNTLTTGTTGGTNTNALGNVHQDSQDYGIGAVRVDIENVVTFQIARRFTRYNYGSEFLRFCPRLSLGDWDAADTKNLVDAFVKLNKINAVHEHEPALRQMTGLPPADPEYKAVLEQRSQQRDLNQAASNQAENKKTGNRKTGNRKAGKGQQGDN